MLTYLQEAGPSYTKKDVDECTGILNDFLDKMSGSDFKADAMR